MYPSKKYSGDRKWQRKFILVDMILFPSRKNNWYFIIYISGKFSSTIKFLQIILFFLNVLRFSV